MADTKMKLTATLKGHGGWVTQVVTNNTYKDMLISASRDKSLIMWNMSKENPAEYGHALKRLNGHDHFISDVVVSGCGQFAVSASWDKTLRLWNLEEGQTTTIFNGHTEDVLSVAFSADNRQIISCSRDRTIKLWNTLGEEKWTQKDKDCHDSWISTVRFSPTAQNPVIVSGGWDNIVKVWHLSNFQLRSNFTGHTGFLNSVTVSPDGSLCASGGQDGKAMLWDLGETNNNPLHIFEGGAEISTLCFSPNRYWLCAAVGEIIKIWDLERKIVVDELTLSEEETEDSNKKTNVKCLSLAWTADGTTLYAGYSDNNIRVWELC